MAGRSLATSPAVDHNCVRGGGAVNRGGLCDMAVVTLNQVICALRSEADSGQTGRDKQTGQIEDSLPGALLFKSTCIHFIGPFGAYP